MTTPVDESAHRYRQVSHPVRDLEKAHQYAACTQEIPIHSIKASRCRTVPHGSFAAVQDDITGGGVIRMERRIGSFDGQTTRPLYHLLGEGDSLVDEGLTVFLQAGLFKCEQECRQSGRANVMSRQS